MKIIDGARGEGGGQVVRLALSLAAATSTPLRIERIRAGRTPPGLKAQHATVARALAEITDGEVEGADVGSTTLAFRPSSLAGGDYEFAIPTAGSVTLLLQGLLPAIAASRRDFNLVLRGGTDAPKAPTWDYFERVEVPLLAQLGVHLECEAERRGFYPQGGGEARIRVEGAALAPVNFEERGAPRGPTLARAVGNGLKREILERALAAARDALIPEGPVETEWEHHRGPGTGMCLTLVAPYARSVLGAAEVGARGRRAEDVGLAAAHALKADRAAGAAVDAHASDALPVFLALAGGGSYTARGPLSMHARTVVDLIPEFLPVAIEVSEMDRIARVLVRRT